MPQEKNPRATGATPKNRSHRSHNRLTGLVFAANPVPRSVNRTSGGACRAPSVTASRVWDPMMPMRSFRSVIALQKQAWNSDYQVENPWPSSRY